MVASMTWLTRLTQALTRQDATAGYGASVIPPRREHPTDLSPSQASAIPAVHRALQIITTAAVQVSLDVERGGQILTGSAVPWLVRRPCIDMTRAEFVEHLVIALATTGDAYIFSRQGGDGRTVSLDPIDPHLVQPWTDQRGRVLYSYDGHDYDRRRMSHLRYLTLPGRVSGMGPLEAAQRAMTSTTAMADYAAGWWTTGQPAGILHTDMPLSDEDARRYRNAWNLLDAEGRPQSPGDNPSRVRVLGKGLQYQPLMISPKDAMWLEAQSFNTEEVARVFGVPASLMLASPDGGTQTYQNVEQEWLGFVRFTLMAYLRKIEDALTELAPMGQTVRFNVEGLLRADTTTRYAAHRTAIEAGFMTVDEVRAIEHLPTIQEQEDTHDRD